MRDPKRIKKVLKIIEEVWKRNPDLRLCQLIGNVFPGDNYYIEDTTLVKKLKTIYKDKDAE